MNLILLEPSEVGADGRARVGGSRARHLLEVLGVGIGQGVRIGVVDGPWGTGVVEAVGVADVTLTCRLEKVAPPLPRVDLLLALPRPKVMRRLWAQLAALGVGRIILTNAERVERHYFDTHILAHETYRALLIEGLQQARDTRLPTVSIHRQFRVLVEDELDRLSAAHVRLFADPGDTMSAWDALAVADLSTRVLLAVGPEGGWNEFERNLLQSRGFRAISLGPRTLRSDTACVALLAVVHDALRTARRLD